ncbi:hypothetical protein IKF81_03035 [Candidatus Saccharibacteria bacterium]|nr:hypothetical protein [Candidatus Saccharibacteria bacterium]
MVKEKKKEKEEKKKNKIWIVVLIIFICLAVLGAGALVAKNLLMKPKISQETILVPEDTEVFSKVFREYLGARVGYAWLTRYGFREMSAEEILEELASEKEIFSKLSKEVGGNFEKSEFSEISGVISNDATIFLKVIRELRAAITGARGDEADQQLAFMNAATKNEGEFRSEVYLARGAYEEETKDISRDGILIFQGDAMVEVGGGVMNIFVGNFETNATATTMKDLSEVVKRIESKGLFGYEGGKLYKIGGGVREEIEAGKLVNLGIEKKGEETEVVRTVTPLLGESTWSLEEKLKERGVGGVLDKEGRNGNKVIKETLEYIKGERTGEK